MMVLHGHAPIIADHVNTFLFNPPGREIPITGIANVGFFPFLTVDPESPTTEFNPLSLQGNNSFQ